VYGRIAEAALLIEHRHSDGTWSRLEPMAHHDAAAHDPERDWARGQTIYSCATCNEMVRVENPNHEAGEDDS